MIKASEPAPEPTNQQKARLTLHQLQATIHEALLTQDADVPRLIQVVRKQCDLAESELNDAGEPQQRKALRA